MSQITNLIIRLTSADIRLHTKTTSLLLEAADVISKLYDLLKHNNIDIPKNILSSDYTYPADKK